MTGWDPFGDAAPSSAPPSGGAPPSSGGGWDPFSNETLSAGTPAPQSAPPNRGIFGQISHAVLSLAPGLVGMAGQGAAELGHGVTLAERNALSFLQGDPGAAISRNAAEITHAPTSPQFQAEHPLTAQVEQSWGRTLQRGGTLLSGHNPYGLASKQGNTVAALLEDAANLGLVFEGGAKAFEPAATAAAGRATEAGAAAEEAAKAVEAANAAHEASLAEQAKAPLDPTLAARTSATQAEMLRAAQEADAARAAAEEAAQHAARLSTIHKTMQTAANFGNRAANSPFAPLELGQKVIGKGLGALGEHVAPDLVEQFRAFGERHQEKIAVRNELRTMNERRGEVTAQQARAEEARQQVLGATSPNDPVMAAHRLYAEGTAQAVAHVAGHSPEAMAATADLLAHHANVTPEAARLALEVATGQHPEMRAKFDRANEIYAARAEAPATATYVRGLGERGIEDPQAYAEHALWNAGGEEARPRGPEAVKLERLQGRREQQAQRVEAAQGRLEKVQGRHPSGALPRDPAELVRAVYKPLNVLAQRIVRDPSTWDHLAEDSVLGPTVRRLPGLPPERAVGMLSDALLRMLDTRPERLSPIGRQLVDAVRGALPETVPKFGATAGVPRVGALGGVEKAARASATADLARTRGEWAANLMADADGRLNAANERAARTIAEDPRMVGAVNRLAQRAQRLQRLVAASAEAARREGALDPYVAAGKTPRELAKEILGVRQDVKAILRAEADTLMDELREADVLPLGKPPRKTVVRDGKRVKVTQNDGAWEGWESIPNRFKGNQRYVAEGGHTIEEAIDNWKQYLSSGRSHTHMGAGQEAGHIANLSVDDLISRLEHVERTRKMEHVDAQFGWERAAAERGGGGGLFGGTGLRAPKYGQVPSDLVAQVLGVDVRDAIRYLRGTPKDAAEAVVRDVAATERAGRVAPPTPGFEELGGGDVAGALERGLGGERNPARNLDVAGRAIYGTERAGVAELGGAEKLAGAQERVRGLAQDRGEQLRERGIREGTAIGAAQEAGRIGHGELVKADTLYGRNTERAASLPGAQVEAVAKAAGRVGRRYYAEGVHATELRGAARALGVAQRGLDRLDSRVADQMVRAAEDVRAAPRVYRPMLQMARKVQDGMTSMAAQADGLGIPGASDLLRSAAAEATVNLKQAVDAGIEPHYFQGGEAPSTPMRGPARPTGALPRERATGNRKVGLGLQAEREGDTTARMAARRQAQIVENEAAFRIGDTYGASAEDVLGADRVAEMHQMGADEFNAARRDLIAEADERGLKVWNPRSPISPIMDVHGITQKNLDELRLLPSHIIDEFGRPHVDALGKYAAIRGYDRLNQGVKNAWLGLSGRFVTGRFIGHSITGMLGAGVGPVTFGKAMADAWRITRQGPIPDEAVLSRLHPTARAALDEGAFTPAALHNRGEIAAMFPRDMPEVSGVARAAQPLKWSRQFTAKLDNIANLGLFLIHAERGLTDAGYHDFLAKYPEFEGMPRAQVEKEAAIRLTLRTLGDFKDMSPMERNVISRAVFFYPWIRHITKLAFNLAAHNTLRTVWTLHLADMFNRQNDTGVPWLDSALNLGRNNFLRYPSTYNPFADLTRLYGDEGPNPAGLTGSLSPVLSLGAAAILGYNTRTGLPISRPPGSGNLDPTSGAEAPTALWDRPGELANYAIGLVPQAAAVRDLLSGNTAVHYPTGQTIHYQRQNVPTDQFTPGGRRFAGLVPLLGLPYEQHVNTAQILKTAGERRGRAASQQRAYARGGKPQPTTSTTSGAWDPFAP